MNILLHSAGRTRIVSSQTSLGGDLAGCDGALIETEREPTATVEATLKVSVLEVAAGLGLNEAVTPRGRLDADSKTLAANPYMRANGDG